MQYFCFNTMRWVLFLLTCIFAHVSLHLRRHLYDIWPFNITFGCQIKNGFSQVGRPKTWQPWFWSPWSWSCRVPSQASTLFSTLVIRCLWLVCSAGTFHNGPAPYSASKNHTNSIHVHIAAVLVHLLPTEQTEGTPICCWTVYKYTLTTPLFP